jgi:tRNA (adenine37-N6)-methyltransferase
MTTPPLSSLCIEPIGVVHSPFGERVDAPRQPVVAAEVEGTVELFAGKGYEDALCDLAAWDHIWLVVWFDRNRGFRAKVTPPRGDKKRGLFATRSPYRPNPIGLSAVQLLSVQGLTLRVRGLDLLDGTPVLDIKPYVPYTDSIPTANHGWLDGLKSEGARPTDPFARFEVQFSAQALAQLAFLKDEHSIDLQDRIEAQLILGPAPHAYRRIRMQDGRLQLAIKEWRVWFAVVDRCVTVQSLVSGFRPKELFGTDGTAPAVHRQFAAKWPG